MLKKKVFSSAKTSFAFCRLEDQFALENAFIITIQFRLIFRGGYMPNGEKSFFPCSVSLDDGSRVEIIAVPDET